MCKVPHDWKESPLNSVADIRVSNVDKKTTPGEKRVKLCNYMDVYSSDYIDDGSQFMEATASDSEISQFRIERGDVLITKDSESPDDIAVPALVDDNVANLVCGYHLAILRPYSMLEGTWLLNQLRHHRAQRHFSKLATGSTRYGLSKSTIERFPVWLPSLTEQKKASLILKTIDDAIRKTEQVIEKLKAMKQGLLHDLLTRGIDDNGELRPSPTEAPHLYKDSPLGLIPRGWGVEKLASVSTFITSGSRGWANYYADSGPLFVRIGNLTREHINLRFGSVVYVSPPSGSEGERTTVLPDDLLVSITADLGIIGVAPHDLGEAYVNQHISLVRLDALVVQPRWVGHYLSGRAGQRQFVRLNDQGAKSGLNLPTVANLQVALPMRSEQEFVVATLDEIDEQVRRERVEADKLRTLKRGIMDDLLTGRVRVKLVGSLE